MRMYIMRFLLESFFLLFLFSCQSQTISSPHNKTKDNQILQKRKKKKIVVGAERLDTICKILQGKTVGLVANQTSRVNGTHLLDTLLALHIDVERIFSPEHGFRGKADPGEEVNSGYDKKTGLKIVSLYGDNRKPKSNQLKGLDILVFDIQSVGARFYTYISTLHLVMEAAAESNISVIVLDRPNPNGSYIDGPIRQAGFQSFVGMDPIPIVYGMTIGELAKMINGEGWLKEGVKCDLTVVRCLNYSHDKSYSLPVSPSPNLRSDEAIRLYPSLCLFEGTVVSVGRGTKYPFEVFGHPKLKKDKKFSYHFIPKGGFGSSNPKLEGKECYGKNLKIYADTTTFHHLHLDWLINAYHVIGGDFFNDDWFDLLAGTDQLRKQIIAGKTAQEIRTSWQKELKEFKEKRQKYLLYK